MSEQRLQSFIPLLMAAIAGLAILAAGVLLLKADHLSSPSSQTDQAPSVQASADEPFLAYTAPSESSFPQELLDDGWEILEPVQEEEREDEKKEIALLPDELHEEEELQEAAPAGRSGGGNATIVVITNFTRAEVFVNGEAYPTYSDDGQNRGFRVPSGQENEVRVRFDGNEKIYRVSLRPGERRLLMVELTGFKAGPPPAPLPERDPRPPRERDLEDIPDEESQITVYSRPRGTIFVDERDFGEETPGTVSVEPGRREVQVRYEDGQMSETKVVRAREGSRIKLFFRQDE